MQTYLYREIYWQRLSDDEIKNFHLGYKKNPKKTAVLTFSNDSKRELNLTIEYDDDSFQELIEEKFSVTYSNSCLHSITYVSKHNSKTEIPPEYSAIGLINEEGTKCIIVGGGFGVFKSVISGFVSHLYDSYVPAHAAALSINGKGALLVGGSGAGKTSTLIKLIMQGIKIGYDIEVLCDDWVAVGKTENDSYFAISFDRSISITKDMLKNDKDIIIQNSEFIESQLEHRNKISYPPSVIAGKSVETERIDIDLIVLLHPFKGTNKLREIDDGVFCDGIIESAYHYPYFPDRASEHRNFWMNARKKINSYGFNTRPRSGPHPQDIDPILKLFPVK